MSGVVLSISLISSRARLTLGGSLELPQIQRNDFHESGDHVTE